MPNDYGVPTEQNDRLLELAGGCRHEWRRVNEIDEPQMFVCRRCGCEDYETPTVGDGHQMTLGEMFRLGDKLNRELWGGKATVYIWTQNGIFKASVQIECESWEQGDDYYESDDCDDPEAALAAAILAAVDGEKA